MTRRGKIARLPREIREQVNRRLENGEEGKSLLAWLNGLAETQAMVAAEFEGQPITKDNLSLWRLGGYRDWQEHQDALELARQLGGDAAQLGEASTGQMTDHLAVCVAARVALALQPSSRPDQGDAAGQLARLQKLWTGVASLRRAEQGAEWLRLERDRLQLEHERIKLEVQKFLDKSEAQRREEAADSYGPITDETIARLEEELKLL